MKNLNPQFEDPRLNSLLEQGHSHNTAIETPAKSKRKDYRGISGKNKKKPAKRASPVEKRPVNQNVSVQPVDQHPPAVSRVSSISSISSTDDSPAARTVMSLLSQKVTATSEVARKWKISQLVESQSQESDEEVEEETRPSRQKRARGGKTGHGRGGRGRGK